MPFELNRGLDRRIFEERGSESIVSAMFSPDGKWLATLDQASRGPWDIEGRHTLVRLWDAATWAPVASYEAGALATSMVWQADSRRAFIGHADGSVSEIELAPAADPAK